MELPESFSVGYYIVLYRKTKVIGKTQVSNMEHEVTGCTTRLVNLLKMGVKRQYFI
jgi:hypothetical protein